MSTAHQSCCSSAKKTKLQPLSDRVMVRRLDKEESLGGILLPDTAKKKQEQAEVIAIGPGKLDKNGQLIPMPVKPGDTILMEKYTGQEITLDEKEYVILRANDIIAIIE